SPAGGTIVDGTYYLTSYTKYFSSSPDGSNSQQRQTTAVISGNGTMLQLVDYRSEDNRTDRISATFSPNGTTLTVTFSCGQQGGDTPSYTATSTSFTVFDMKDGSTDVQVFTKQ